MNFRTDLPVRSPGYKRSYFSIGLFALSAMLCAPTARALPTCLGLSTSLAPGGAVSPGDCTGVGAGTLLATLTAPFSSATGKVAGTLVSAVYQETGGTLDFLFQVMNGTNCTNPTPGAGCDPMIRVTDFSFAGVTTGAATRTDGGNNSSSTGLGGGDPFVNGDTTPSTADRNAPGDTVGFSFPQNLGDQINPGHGSIVLIITTNATSFTVGHASVVDGGTTTVASFQPLSTAPEPASFGLISLGLFAVGALRRKFRA